MEDLRKEVASLNLWLSKYSFGRLVIVTATGFIPVSLLSIVSMNVMSEAGSGLERILFRLLVKNESMARCTVCHNITMFKNGLTLYNQWTNKLLYPLSPPKKKKNKKKTNKQTKTKKNCTWH